jgi:hypothetical protein
MSHLQNSYSALQNFAAQMIKVHQVSDGLLTARVIGEFSAGKTRFLRELLGETIPPALYPVSSLERQTRLPLEITYGTAAALTLVLRANDYDINDKTVTLKTLTEFLGREETLQHDPLQHRLRLTIPDNRLILKNGDGYSDDKSAKRLFLIDMPGWNSGDDMLAEGDASEIMAGFHNLALVYVVSAVRLDGLKNSERLNNFLQAFADADFIGTPHLIIMTHCLATESVALQAKVKKQVQTMWAALGEASTLSMDLFSIDFEDACAEELAMFRNQFWQSLLSPLDQSAPAAVQHPWIHSLHCWPKQWHLDEPIKQSQMLLAQARVVLQSASQKQNYLLGMNMTKLGGLDNVAITKRLQETWSRQMRDTVAGATKPLHECIPLLDAKHPLAEWWNTYWIVHLANALHPIADFLDTASKTFNQVSPHTADLSKHLHLQLDSAYHQAMEATHSSFTQVLDTLQHLPKETPPEKTLATLLRLGLLHMRYLDHLNSENNCLDTNCST